MAIEIIKNDEIHENVCKSVFETLRTTVDEVIKKEVLTGYKFLFIVLGALTAINILANNLCEKNEIKVVYLNLVSSLLLKANLSKEDIKEIMSEIEKTIENDRDAIAGLANSLYNIQGEKNDNR